MAEDPLKLLLINSKRLNNLPLMRLYSTFICCAIDTTTKISQDLKDPNNVNYLLRRVAVKLLQPSPF